MKAQLHYRNMTTPPWRRCLLCAVRRKRSRAIGCSRETQPGYERLPTSTAQRRSTPLWLMRNGSGFAASQGRYSSSRLRSYTHERPIDVYSDPLRPFLAR